MAEKGSPKTMEELYENRFRAEGPEDLPEFVDLPGKGKINVSDDVFTSLLDERKDRIDDLYHGLKAKKSIEEAEDKLKKLESGGCLAALGFFGLKSMEWSIIGAHTVDSVYKTLYL